MLKSWLAWRLPPKMIFWQNNKKDSGFTLIELILALSIGSIVLLSLYSILNFTMNVCKAREGEDEVLLNGRYAIEYIKREIECAEEIIDIKLEIFSEIDEKYEENIGFIIMRYEPEATGGKKYNYSTYYIRNNKIYRIAANTQNDQYPRGSMFGGHNVIAEYVVSFNNTNIDFDTRLIDLCLAFKKDKGQEISFNTKIKVRCPVVY